MCGKCGGTRVSSEQVEQWECDSGDGSLPCLLGERQSVLPLSSNVPPCNRERVEEGSHELWGLHRLCLLKAQSGSCPLEVAECLQQLESWHSAQVPRCLAACTVHTFVVEAAPNARGVGVGSTVGEKLGTGAVCELSCCPFSFGQHC